MFLEDLPELKIGAEVEVEVQITRKEKGEDGEYQEVVSSEVERKYFFGTEEGSKTGVLGTRIILSDNPLNPGSPSYYDFDDNPNSTKRLVSLALIDQYPIKPEA